MLQPQYFLNRTTNSDSGHMSNYIRQNEVNVANEPLKVQKPLLESSSELGKLPCITNTENSTDTNIIVIGKGFVVREF